jgi:hypothetical protein
VDPRDPIAELRARLAQAHREAAAALDAGDDEGYETAVAVGEIYRIRLAAVRGHGVSSLPSSNQSGTVGGMVASEMLQEVKDGRPGRAIKSKGPMGVAAKNSGLALREIARRLDVPYPTLKAWDRRKSGPSDIVKKKLAAKPYLVPLTSWKS